MKIIRESIWSYEPDGIQWKREDDNDDQYEAFQRELLALKDTPVVVTLDNGDRVKGIVLEQGTSYTNLRIRIGNWPDLVDPVATDIVRICTGSIKQIRQVTK